MTYLRRPSTYVIGAVAIVLWIWVIPMFSGYLGGRKAQGGS